MRPPTNHLVLVLLGLGLVSCGGASAQPASPAVDTHNVQARLAAGPWVLARYQPDDPAGRMFGPLLAQQLGALVVTFDGQTMHAQSPTFAITRPYTVQNAAGFVFDFVSPDPDGSGAVRSHCEISEDGRRIDFVTQTDPWAGQGELQRQGP